MCALGNGGGADPGRGSVTFGCPESRSGIDMGLRVVECAQRQTARVLPGPEGGPGHMHAQPPHGAGGFVDLKLGHHSRDGVEIVDVEGEIDVYTAPRLRELLIELVSNGFYQLVVNMEKVEFLDSTGLGVLVGGLKRVRAHDGSLDLVCTQERILKIFRITGLTKVFGIHETVDGAIEARKSEK
jgi:anti-sigma B factor antagonist